MIGTTATPIFSFEFSQTPSLQWHKTHLSTYTTTTSQSLVQRSILQHQSSAGSKIMIQTSWWLKILTCFLMRNIKTPLGSNTEMKSQWWSKYPKIFEIWKWNNQHMRFNYLHCDDKVVTYRFQSWWNWILCNEDPCGMINIRKNRLWNFISLILHPFYAIFLPYLLLDWIYQ